MLHEDIELLSAFCCLHGCKSEFISFSYISVKNGKKLELQYAEVSHQLIESIGGKRLDINETRYSGTFI